MVNTINTLESDNNFELTRGRVNYEAAGKKNSRKVRVFLSTSCTSGISFSLNLHRSQLVVLSLLFPQQYGNITVTFIQRIATRHPKI